MNTQTLAVFTAKSVSTILNEGGTQAWVLDRANARRCSYAVLCRNTRAEWGPPKDKAPESHGSAFLVGRISDVVSATDRETRWKIVFDEYAEISIPGLWEGWRNPVKYTTLEKLGIDVEILDFKPMPAPQPDEAEPAVPRGAQPMTIERAKQELAATFGVKPGAIEITIRG